MSTSTKLDKDANGKNIDEKLYSGMIDSLLYLTATRSDIMFSVCLCTRFQASPKESHLYDVKQIIRMLKALRILGYIILNMLVLIYWDIVMLILLEVKLIKKVQVEHVNILAITLYLGLVRNKIMLHFLLQRRTILLPNYDVLRLGKLCKTMVSNLIQLVYYVIILVQLTYP